LRAPLGEVEAAYRKAIELLPYEPRFATELRSMQALRGGPARRRGAGGA
jgi:hypothetical protein